MKNRIVKFIAVLLAVMTLMPFVVSAGAYQTYTYSIDGQQLPSPDAYAANRKIIN